MRQCLILLFVVAITAYAHGMSATNSSHATTLPHTKSPDFIKIEISANPTNDFRTAIATNDVRFVGCMGYALLVPGVKDYYRRYEASNGIKVIEGTSDMILPTTFPAAVAHRYAEAYNKLLLRYLKTKQTK